MIYFFWLHVKHRSQFTSHGRGRRTRYCSTCSDIAPKHGTTEETEEGAVGSGIDLARFFVAKDPSCFYHNRYAPRQANASKAPATGQGSGAWSAQIGTDIR